MCIILGFRFKLGAIEYVLYPLVFKKLFNCSYCFQIMYVLLNLYIEFEISKRKIKFLLMIH